MWLGIPIVSDNIGNDFIPRKHYASDTPTSRMLKELAAHSLPANTAIVSDQMEGVSGKWPICAGKLSRNSYIPTDGDKQRVPNWDVPKCRRTDIRGKSAGWLKVALFLKDRKRIIKSPHLEGGRVPKLKIKKPDRAQRKRGGRVVYGNGNLSRGTTWNRQRPT